MVFFFMFETFFEKTKSKIGNILFFFLEDHFRSTLIRIITVLNSKTELTEKKIPKTMLVKLEEDYYPSKTEGNVIDIRDLQKDKQKEKDFKNQIKTIFDLPDPPDSVA